MAVRKGIWILWISRRTSIHWKSALDTPDSLWADGIASCLVVAFVALLQHKKNMSPVGAVVLVIGVESSAYHCNCEHHSICGSIVKLDTLLRFEKLLVEDGK